MSVFTAANSECAVYIYREGFLSAVGHDLKLRVSNYVITVDDHPLAVRGEFHADSIRVVGTVTGTTVHTDEPPAEDKRQIEASIVREVLAARQHPLITFSSVAIERTGDGYLVTGWLELHGTRKELQFVVQQHADRARAEVLLHQPDFGITPYRAFFGALRVKADVRIDVVVPIAASDTRS